MRRSTPTGLFFIRVCVFLFRLCCTSYHRERRYGRQQRTDLHGFVQEQVV